MAIQDIHPKTSVDSLSKDYSDSELKQEFSDELVSALVGMQPEFVRRVLGTRKKLVSLADVLALLDQDAYSETFVPRSKIPLFLLTTFVKEDVDSGIFFDKSERHLLHNGDSRKLIRQLPNNSINCVVTSTPYWGMRLYNNVSETEWADGETCVFGHEQTPEGFIRHSVELLYYLKRAMAKDGSVWWNLMDTYNTRTQIRSNASETLMAMKGKDTRGWKDYECRRYSAGHSFLLDGEQCLIPSRVAERASRIGYWVKSVICWKKDSSMPETVDSRVTREAENILHLTLQRTPYFDKEAYRTLPKSLGGRNLKFESDKVTDVWCLSTASGTDGHGAQFPVALPARCIAFSTREDDVVLDPFVGSGTTSVASAKLHRRSIGFDISQKYLEIAQKRLLENSTDYSLEDNEKAVPQKLL